MVALIYPSKPPRSRRSKFPSWKKTRYKQCDPEKAQVPQEVLPLQAITPVTSGLVSYQFTRKMRQVPKERPSVIGTLQVWGLSQTRSLMRDSQGYEWFHCSSFLVRRGGLGQGCAFRWKLSSIGQGKNEPSLRLNQALLFSLGMKELTGGLSDWNIFENPAVGLPVLLIYLVKKGREADAYMVYIVPGAGKVWYPQFQTMPFRRVSAIDRFSRR